MDIENNSNNSNIELIRSHVDTIIMSSLLHHDKYGLEILNEISEKSNGLYSLKQPTLYSCLKRLEKNGYITSYKGDTSNGAQRVYYKLLDLGRKFVEADQYQWEFSRTVINSLLSDKAFDPNTQQPPFDPSEFRPLTRRQPRETTKTESEPEIRYVYVDRPVYIPAEGAATTEQPTTTAQDTAPVETSPITSTYEDAVVAPDDDTQYEEEYVASDYTTGDGSMDSFDTQPQPKRTSLQDLYPEDNTDSEDSHVEYYRSGVSRNPESAHAVAYQERVFSEDFAPVPPPVSSVTVHDVASEETSAPTYSEQKSESYSANQAFDAVAPSHPTSVAEPSHTFKNATESEAYIQQSFFSQPHHMMQVTPPHKPSSEPAYYTEPTERPKQPSTTHTSAEQIQSNYISSFDAIYASEQAQTLPQTTDTQEEHFDYLTINEMKVKFASEGYCVKPYIKKDTTAFYSGKYFLCSKLLFQSAWIFYIFFALQLVLTHLLAHKTYSIANSWLAFGLILPLLYPLTCTALYVKSPKRKKQAHFQARTALINSLIVMINCVVIILLVGYFGFHADFTVPSTTIMPIVVPILYLLNIPIDIGIYATMYHSKRYHIQ